MKIRFRQEAELELQDALAWYEHCTAGLGGRFLEALDDCLDRIVRFPQAYPLVRGQARRALLQQFPYSLVFLIEADGILIISCRHFRQRSPQ